MNETCKRVVRYSYKSRKRNMLIKLSAVCLEKRRETLERLEKIVEFIQTDARSLIGELEAAKHTICGDWDSFQLR